MIPKKKDEHTLYCSFCGKSQHEVKKLVAGPTVFICDECIMLCFDILAEEKLVPTLSDDQRALLPKIYELKRKVTRVIERERARLAPLEEFAKALGEFSAAQPKIESTEPTRLPDPPSS